MLAAYLAAALALAIQAVQVGLILGLRRYPAPWPLYTKHYNIPAPGADRYYQA